MSQAAAEWIASLEGLSGEPLIRAAQIALAAIDRYMSDEEGHDVTKLEAAHDELQAALAGPSGGG